jgi:Cu+-exporting ATPase
MSTDTAPRTGTSGHDNFVVRDIHCSVCAATLGNAVAEIPGVVRVNVEPTIGWTDLDYDPSVVSKDELEEAVEAAGYEIVRTWG